MRRAALASMLLALLVAEPSYAERELAEPERQTELEIEAVSKTQALLESKYHERKAEMTTRVRAMYKLSRASWPRIWFEPEIRKSASRWLGAARRITRRDIAELALLENEIAVTTRDQKRLAEQAALAALKSEDLSLLWPVEDSRIVSSFGDHRGPSRRIRLRRRGVILRARSGSNVVAPADGRVLYLGDISGLGKSLIIEHGPADAPIGVTILGGLGAIAVSVSADLKAGESVATANAAEIYLEHRRGSGGVYRAVDPEPLMR